jgi:hypothetical protein
MDLFQTVAEHLQFCNIYLPSFTVTLLIISTTRKASCLDTKSTDRPTNPLDIYLVLFLDRILLL